MAWQRIYLILTAVWLIGNIALTKCHKYHPDEGCDTETAAEVQLLRHDLESLETCPGNFSVQLGKLDDIIERIDSYDQKLERISQQLEQISKDVYVPNDYRKTYKVHHFQSPLGRYEYNLTSAEIRCQQEGMTIATLQQLEVAWKEGMNVCQCGWLSDGTNRFPSQYPWKGFCGYTSGVNTCGRTLANVYCFSASVSR